MRCFVFVGIQGRGCSEELTVFHMPFCVSCAHARCFPSSTRRNVPASGLLLGYYVFPARTSSSTGFIWSEPSPHYRALHFAMTAGGSLDCLWQRCSRVKLSLSPRVTLFFGVETVSSEGYRSVQIPCGVFLALHPSLAILWSSIECGFCHSTINSCARGCVWVR